MKKIAVVAVALAVSGPAWAGNYSYMQQCNNFQCRNKAGLVCDTVAHLKKANLANTSRNDQSICEGYVSEFRKIVVLQQTGKFCKIQDGSHAGWTFCNYLQYNTSD